MTLLPCKPEHNAFFCCIFRNFPLAAGQSPDFSRGTRKITFFGTQCLLDFGFVSYFEEKKEGSAEWRQFYAALFDERLLVFVSYTST